MNREIYKSDNGDVAEVFNAGGKEYLQIGEVVNKVNHETAREYLLGKGFKLAETRPEGK